VAKHHGEWIFVVTACILKATILSRFMSTSTDQRFPVALADAAGNKVLVVDARHSLLSPNQVHLLFRKSTYRTCVPPDIFTILTIREGRLRADFWNPDGTRESLCGNAIRCLPLVLQAWSADLIHNYPTPIDTSLGTVMANQIGEKRTSMTLSMETISLEQCAEPNATLVHVGTPHCVLFVTDLLAQSTVTRGQQLSTGASPVNATFVVKTGQMLQARVFERGVGETRSCGTGAIAAAVAFAHATGEWKRTSRRDLIEFVSSECLEVVSDTNSEKISVSGRCELIHLDTFVTDESMG
jgi:diaminopimelate epimerase